MKERPTILVKKEFSERAFYEYYLGLRNLQIPKNQKLTNKELALTAIICSQPQGYTLDSQKSKQGRSKKYELATQLGIPSTGIYKLLQQLEDKNILYNDEDGFIELVPALKNLTENIKIPMELDYTIRINLDDSN